MKKNPGRKERRHTQRKVEKAERYNESLGKKHKERIERQRTN